jgi:hypothetical protein
MIEAAVDDEDTAVTIPGIKPDADTKVIIELSIVLTTKLPTSPTYNPPAVNGKDPIGLEPVIV